MNEIVLGSKKMNRGEQLGVAVSGAALALYAIRFNISTLWVIATAIYATIVLLLLLRSQRFVIVNQDGIDYKSTYFGTAKFYAWQHTVKIIANSTGVALHFKDGNVVEFKAEESKWFNFRKFRTTVEKFAQIYNIQVFIHVVEVPGEISASKRLPEH